MCEAIWVFLTTLKSSICSDKGKRTRMLHLVFHYNKGNQTRYASTKERNVLSLSRSWKTAGSISHLRCASRRQYNFRRRGPKDISFDSGLIILCLFYFMCIYANFLSSACWLNLGRTDVLFYRGHNPLVGGAPRGHCVSPFTPMGKLDYCLVKQHGTQALISMEC